MLDEKLSDKSILVQRVIVCAAVVLIFKLGQMQLFDQTYSERAQATTLDKKTLYPSRGLIFDRSGELLVYNNAIYDLKATYNQIPADMDTAKFCRLLGMSNAEYNSRINQDWNSPRFSKKVPFIFKQNISPVIFATLQESLHEFPGFSAQLRNVRGYQHPIAAHVLGYISEVDKKRIENSEGAYAQGDYIGTTGIEMQYEDELRGKKGVAYILKDNLGREVGDVQEGKLHTTAVSGSNLFLTLDKDLQAYGERLMQNKKGSIVCIEPSTGEVLAMVSAPDYDPELLTIHAGRTEAFTSLTQDTVRRPLFDRSLMAAYPPGSIIKPVLALIGMQEEVLTADRTIFCEGAYHYRHYSYGCHEHSTPYNVQIGLQHSCNSYFFQVFRDIIEKNGFDQADRGLKTLNSYLREFGLGRKLNLDLPQEKEGNLPQPEFYDDLYGKGKWRSTYVLSLGIGQGELELSTLQMANLAAIIANRGYYLTPHLIKNFNTLSAEEVKTDPQKYYVSIDKEHFEPVVEGMARAVNGGTAATAGLAGIQVCGKTGTSQNPHGKDHSVLFAFAPMENPQIAIAVYVENGGWGATYASPIAGLMIEQYLKGEIAGNRRWLENRMLEADLLALP